MEIPEEVKKEAHDLIKQYNGSLEYLGDVEGQKAWLLNVPDDVTIGFPFLYLYKDGEALTVTGMEVFNFINLYVKDVDKSNIE